MTQQTTITRRDFLTLTGATLSAGILQLGLPHILHQGVAQANGLPAHPNLLFIVTDQERSPQHWPDDWDYATNLPARQRLLNHGLNFERHFCNSAMCSPSRATLFTGLYPAQHQLTMTLTYDEPLSDTETTLSPHYQNMAQMLASAGYYVAWKGKWHLSKNAAGGKPDANDVAAFGVYEWEPTSAGEAQDPADYGGGCADNDDAIVTQAINFLQTYSSSAPFALFVMLVNPHDVIAYPNGFEDETCGENEYANTADFDLGIDLPPTIDEDLSTKPDVQAQSRDLYATFLGTLLLTQHKHNYVNFYADLHMRIDAQIGAVLDVLETAGHLQDTVIIRTADHGEMGLSHGGLRQKMFNAYEETMRVPLIISNPVLFPTPQTTAALASLVDLMPTVASLANAPHRAAWRFSGFDLSPLFQDPTQSVQDAVLFTFDDERAGTGFTPPFIQQPNHIHCLREANWKFARYYDPAGVETPQYELYDLVNDPLEQYNRAGDPAYATEQERLAQRLDALVAERLAPPWQTYLPLVTRP
jgi:choline-sulfatase